MTEMRFEVMTPLGFTVRTSQDYWQLILRKQPEVGGLETKVRKCLHEPDIIRRSARDPAVYLFYARLPSYMLAIVVKRLDHEGFVVTCYLTDRAKEGAQIWPASE